MAAQKKSPVAAERDEGAREAFRARAGEVDPQRFVWVDECGTHTSMARLRARAPRGQRAYGKVPRNRGKNTTLIASMTLGGAMGECMAVEGSTKAFVFEAYVERFLAPTLSEGQVVVMDRLGAHRTRKVRDLIEGRGAELWLLPSYSPDLNPVEEAFSKIKGLLRKAGGRTRRALVEAIGAALSAITTEDVAGWFVHCAYGSEAQNL